MKFFSLAAVVALLAFGSQSQAGGTVLVSATGGSASVTVTVVNAPDPGWTCVQIFVTVVNLSTNQTVDSYVVKPPANPDIKTRAVPAGMYNALVVATAVFRNAAATSETADTKTVVTTILP